VGCLSLLLKLERRNKLPKYHGIIDPTVPEVTWENFQQICLLVVDEPINFYLELQKGKYGMRPIYEPQGHTNHPPKLVWWFPKFIAAGFVERYKANTPSVDPNWPDELAAEIYAECKPFQDHRERQEVALHAQQTARWEFLVANGLVMKAPTKP
jgi:hypothetical protein